MPVQVFVGRTPEGRPDSPDYSHEMRSTLDIVARFWQAFHHHEPYYAMVANLTDPSADLMVLSERGIGVIELKHYFGRVTCRTNGFWYAGPKKMQAGVEGRGFKNPHEQAQSYAEEVRARLLKPPLWQEPWLPGKTIDWPEFKFHTAVCFTHPAADLSQFDENLRRRCRPITLPWEDFSVLQVDDLVAWASSLRFEMGGDRGEGFTQNRLSPSMVQRFLAELFEVAEWQEIYELMPKGQPYATLTLAENGLPIQVIGLDHDQITLGRDLSVCDFAVPERLSLVSRVHARIVRTFDGVFIEDLESTNGSFVDGVRVYRREPLKDGQIITLGRSEANHETAHLAVSFNVDDMSDLEATRKLQLPPNPGD